MTKRLVRILSTSRANLSYPVEVVYAPSCAGAEIYTADKDLPSFDKSRHNSVLVSKKLSTPTFEIGTGAYTFRGGASLDAYTFRGGASLDAYSSRGGASLDAYIYRLPRYGEYISSVRTSVRSIISTILIDSVTGVPIVLSTITVPSGIWMSLLGFPINLFAIHPSSNLILKISFDKSELWLKDNPVIEVTYVSCNDISRRESQDRGYVASTEIQSMTRSKL